MDDWTAPVLGTVAGLCTTGSFLPQVIKVWRERDTAAISARMYWVLLLAFVLWSYYAFLIGSATMIVFNTVNFVLGAVILYLKLKDCWGTKQV